MRTLLRKYTFEKTYYTNISKDYLADSGSNWGEWEMIRESVQNMTDEAQWMVDRAGGQLFDYFNIYKKSPDGSSNYTHLELRDKGRGVDFEQILLIGHSDKRGTHYKGQKGEGESLSFLVAARLGIKKWMFSKDWAATARFEAYGGNDKYQVLVFDIYKASKPIEGTVWRFSLTSYLNRFFDDRSYYFPELSKREQRKEKTKDRNQYKKSKREPKAPIVQTTSNKVIMTPKIGKTARLYVKGIYVKDIMALFSYNLNNVEINRDRSMVDDFQILEGIQNAFNSNDLTSKQAEIYWKYSEEGRGVPDTLEYRKKLFIENPVLMLKAFHKVFGKKSCIFTDNVAANDAISLGWKVLNLHHYAKETALQLGVCSDKQVLGYQGDVLFWDKPSKKAEKLASKLEEIGRAFGFKDYKIVWIKKVLNVNDENLNGYYSGNTVHLLKHLIDIDCLDLLGTYIHECGHGESGYGDGTRGFVNFFEKMLIQALTGSHDHVRNLIKELTRI